MKQRSFLPAAHAFGVVSLALLIGCAASAAAEPQWGEPVQITTGIEVRTVQFLHDGMLLIAASGSVRLINPDGTGSHTLFERQGIGRANMSPDGQTVVLDDDLDISVANRDGSDLRPIASDPDLLEFAISFTPDGKNITFVTIDDVQRVFGIWIMSPDGRNKRNLLTATDMAFRHPRQSPDGSKNLILFGWQGRQTADLGHGRRRRQRTRAYRPGRGWNLTPSELAPRRREDRLLIEKIW